MVKRTVCYPTRGNMYNFNVINLDDRPDRMERVVSEYINSPINITRHPAVKNSVGFLGCAASHKSVILQAKQRGDPYVIAVEDDCTLSSNVTLDNVLDVIQTLESNMSGWQIFNGGPTFWNKRNNLDELQGSVTDFSDDLININWGQTTHFMIYNSKVYEDLIKLFTEPTDHIDVLISENYEQTTYRWGYLYYQYADWSDISERDNAQEYIEYQNKQEMILKSIVT